MEKIQVGRVINKSLCILKATFYCCLGYLAAPRAPKSPHILKLKCGEIYMCNKQTRPILLDPEILVTSFLGLCESLVTISRELGYLPSVTLADPDSEAADNMVSSIPGC